VAGILILCLSAYLGFYNFPIAIDSLCISLFLSLVCVILLTAVYLVWFYFLIPENKFSWYRENVNLQRIKKFFYSAATEEVWFRAVFLIPLLSIFGYWAIFIVAAAFSFIHSEREAGFFFFFMGIFFGGIILYTGNIIGPIIGHLLFNIINHDFIGPRKTGILINK
jgi:membrane protease YdiL (CAAX protease family)